MSDMERAPDAAVRAVAVARTRSDAEAAARLAVGWAPGRINLIGEHTDYSEGYVLPAAIHRTVALAGYALDEPVAVLFSAHHQEEARVALDAPLRSSDAPLWARYVLATWRELAALQGVPEARGFNAVIVGDVPPGAGLSSSAALEVATSALAQALGAAPLAPLDVARACQRAEQAGADVEVGIMDQAASCLGAPGQAILLDCRTLSYTYLPIPLDTARWIVFDTATPHTLAASGYNQRRAECERAVELLSSAAATSGRSFRTLRDVAPDDLQRYGAALDESLLRRARHVVSENERVLRAAEALRAHDLAAFGALMNASHASLRDDFAVSCAELDAAVEIAQATQGVLGARMMGAGFGGSILVLARPDAVSTLEAQLASEYPPRTGKVGAIVECAITGQTGMVRRWQTA